MNLEEKVYSVLVVSSSEKMNTALSDLLTGPRFYHPRIVSTISAARRVFGERAYDLIIINSPLPDDVGIRFAIDLSTSGNAIVLLLVRAEAYDDVFDETAPYGVFTLAKPFPRSVLLMTLDFMQSARERLRTMEQRTISVEEKMKEIRLVNRAKWFLISELKMDEQTAHRYIEKQAMDRCVSKKDIAEDIIRTYT